LVRIKGIKGSKCERCGYAGNFAALEFHHIVPATKSFALDLRSLSNRCWSAILAESGKCQLLCSNCHAEVHNPDCCLEKPAGGGETAIGRE
jgi:5-methylcytosine-specific restriction endonuclease McrA